MIFNNSKYNTHWEVKPLNELGDFSRGKSKHRPRNDEILFKNGKYPFIQTGEIKEANLFVRSHHENYNELGLKQSKIWPKNTLCITIAANIAETALLSYPMCFPDSVVGFNAYTSESTEIFMHYVFTYIKKSIQNSASGSIQDNINIDYLTGLKFRLPKKYYQDSITAVLSALDSKIELNNRINAELEQMSKTLYDYWFVQFDFPDKTGNPYKSSGGKMVWNKELKRAIPDGWEAKRIDQIESNIITGKTPSTKISEYFSGNVPFICIGDVRGNMHIVKTELKLSGKGADTQKNKYIPAGAICVTCIASPGLVGFSTEISQTNQQLNSIVCEKIENKYYLYFYIQDYFKYAKAKTGNTFANMNKEDFSSILVLKPSKDLLNRFSETAKPLIEKNLVNSKENQKLSELRDWLLPMLMNGQIKIVDT